MFGHRKGASKPTRKEMEQRKVSEWLETVSSRLIRAIVDNLLEPQWGWDLADTDACSAAVNMAVSDTRFAHSCSVRKTQYIEMQKVRTTCKIVSPSVQRAPRIDPPQPCSSHTESCNEGTRKASPEGTWVGRRVRQDQGHC